MDICGHLHLNLILVITLDWKSLGAVFVNSDGVNDLSSVTCREMLDLGGLLCNMCQIQSLAQIHVLSESHTYRSVCGIGVASKNYLKWQAIQLAIHSTARV